MKRRPSIFRKLTRKVTRGILHGGRPRPAASSSAPAPAASSATPARVPEWIRSTPTAVTDAPIPMILHCPECRERHIDAGEHATRPHHTHACQSCGFTWRPAVVATVGVQFLPGFKDEPPAPAETAEPG